MSQERSTISLQWSPRSRHMDLHWTALAAQAEKQAKLMFPHEWQQALISYGLVLLPTSIGKPLTFVSRSPQNQTTAMGGASPARSPRRLCTPRGSAASVHQDAQDKNLAALRDFLGPSLFQQRLRDLEIDLQYTVPHAVAQDYCRLMQQVEANVLTTGLTKSIVASAHNALRTPRAQSPSSSRTTTPRGSIPTFPHAQHGKLTALLQQCIRRNIGAFLQTEFAMAASLTRLGLRPEDLQHQSSDGDGQAGERFQGATPSSRTMVSKDHPDDEYTMLMGCSPVVPAEGRRSIVSFAIPAEEGEESEATSPPRAVSRAGGGGGSPRSHVSPSRTLPVEPNDAATTVLPPWHAALVVAVKGVLDQRLGEEADDWPAARFSKTVLLITSQVVSQPALLSTWKKDPHLDRKPKIARVVERLVDAAIQYEREKSQQQQQQQQPEENGSRANDHTEEGVVDEHEDDIDADYQLHDGTVEQLVSSDVALENVFGENPFAVHCVDDDHHDDNSGEGKGDSSPAKVKEEDCDDEDGEANLSPPSTVSNSPLRSTSQFLPQATTDDHNPSQTPRVAKRALLQQERRSPLPTAHLSQQSEFDLLVQEVHRTLIGSPNLRQPKDDRLGDDNANDATPSTATVEDGIAEMSRVLGVSLAADNTNQGEFRRQEDTTTRTNEASMNGNDLSSEQAEELRRELVTLEGQISLLQNRAAAVRQLLGITPL